MDSDTILTGASRGIGRALALELATAGSRLLLVARDAARLDDVSSAVRARGGEALVVAADLGSVAGARETGERLAGLVRPGTTLVHNAGLWPHRREVGADGLERAFVVNCVAPLALQRPLLDGGLLRRIMVVGAGLMVKGRFDPARTPAGLDFSGVRTYCTTKLCQALAMRDVAASHPELDLVVLHPGVVATDLGARPGLVGLLLRLVKRGWEKPESCAARLAQLLALPRWSPPGEARWRFEEAEAPWPPIADDARARAALRDVLATALRS